MQKKNQENFEKWGPLVEEKFKLLNLSKHQQEWLQSLNKIDPLQDVLKAKYPCQQVKKYKEDTPSQLKMLFEVLILKAKEKDSYGGFCGLFENIFDSYQEDFLCYEGVLDLCFSLFPFLSHKQRMKFLSFCNEETSFPWLLSDEKGIKVILEIVNQEKSKSNQESLLLAALSFDSHAYQHVNEWIPLALKILTEDIKPKDTSRVISKNWKLILINHQKEVFDFFLRKKEAKKILELVIYFELWNLQKNLSIATLESIFVFIEKESPFESIHLVYQVVKVLDSKFKFHDEIKKPLINICLWLNDHYRCPLGVSYEIVNILLKLQPQRIHEENDAVLASWCLKMEKSENLQFWDLWCQKIKKENACKVWLFHLQKYLLIVQKTRAEGLVSEEMDSLSMHLEKEDFEKLIAPILLHLDKDMPIQTALKWVDWLNAKAIYALKFWELFLQKGFTCEDKAFFIVMFRLMIVRPELKNFLMNREEKDPNLLESLIKRICFLPKEDFFDCLSVYVEKKEFFPLLSKDQNLTLLQTFCNFFLGCELSLEERVVFKSINLDYLKVQKTKKDDDLHKLILIEFLSRQNNQKDVAMTLLNIKNLLLKHLQTPTLPENSVSIIAKAIINISERNISFENKDAMILDVCAALLYLQDLPAARLLDLLISCTFVIESAILDPLKKIEDFIKNLEITPLPSDLYKIVGNQVYKYFMNLVICCRETHAVNLQMVMSPSIEYLFCDRQIDDCRASYYGLSLIDLVHANRQKKEIREDLEKILIPFKELLSKTIVYGGSFASIEMFTTCCACLGEYALDKQEVEYVAKTFVEIISLIERDLLKSLQELNFEAMENEFYHLLDEAINMFLKILLKYFEKQNYHFIVQKNDAVDSSLQGYLEIVFNEIKKLSVKRPELFVRHRNVFFHFQMISNWSCMSKCKIWFDEIREWKVVKKEDSFTKAFSFFVDQHEYFSIDSFFEEGILKILQNTPANEHEKVAEAVWLLCCYLVEMGSICSINRAMTIFESLLTPLMHVYCNKKFSFLEIVLNRCNEELILQKKDRILYGLIINDMLSHIINLQLLVKRCLELNVRFFEGFTKEKIEKIDTERNQFLLLMSYQRKLVALISDLQIALSKLTESVNIHQMLGIYAIYKLMRHVSKEAKKNFPNVTEFFLFAEELQDLFIFFIDLFDRIKEEDRLMLLRNIEEKQIIVFNESGVEGIEGVFDDLKKEIHFHIKFLDLKNLSEGQKKRRTKIIKKLLLRAAALGDRFSKTWPATVKELLLVALNLGYFSQEQYIAVENSINMKILRSKK